LGYVKAPFNRRPVNLSGFLLRHRVGRCGHGLPRRGGPFRGDRKTFVVVAVIFLVIYLLAGKTPTLP